MLPSNDIQGNIVTPFKRKHGRYLFFEARGPEVREPLGRVLLKYLTSGSSPAMFGLSGSGFARLDLPPAVPEAAGAGETKSFQAGLRNPRYWNPRPEHWEPEYLDRNIDGFLYVADDDLERVRTASAAFEADAAGLAEIVRQEPVKSLRDAYANEYEHFGFRDDMTKGVDPKRVLLHETWMDHGADPPPLGCFAVVLKIEQHADRFAAATEGLAAAAQVSADDAGERIIGRARSGELTDPSICPFQAHVRVMNPRDGSPEPVIIRRGMAYGPTTAEAPAGAARGLMFLSLHRSIMDFTTLMFRAEYARDPILSTATDWTPDYIPPNGCLVGRRPGQKWEINGQTVCYPIADLTTIRGGEYFYIPSLSFVRMLAGQLAAAGSAV